MSDYRNYFKNNDLVLSKLEKLHVKKYHLKEMISAKDIPPFIVEFSGLPRTGKSSSLNRVYDFFKQANIRIEKTTEPAQIIKESMSKEEVSKLTNVEFNNQTLYIAKEELSRKINQQPSIIIQDRGVIDNYFWYQMMYDEGKIDANFYEQLLLNLYQDLECVDQLFILCAEPETIIIRDYINQIYLEPRKKTTMERVTQLKNGLDHLLPLIKKNISSNRLIELDTTNMGEVETSIVIADKMLDGVYNKIRSRTKQ